MILYIAKYCISAGHDGSTQLQFKIRSRITCLFINKHQLALFNSDFLKINLLFDKNSAGSQSWLALKKIEFVVANGIPFHWSMGFPHQSATTNSTQNQYSKRIKHYLDIEILMKQQVPQRKLKVIKPKMTIQINEELSWINKTIRENTLLPKLWNKVLRAKYLTYKIELQHRVIYLENGIFHEIWNFQAKNLQ